MIKNLVVGLTGGIACGKTTIAGMFKSLGAYVIDADLAGHQILRKDPDVKKQLLETFGECILNDKGEIDRAKLGCVVFDNLHHLQSLNRIIHPPIIKAINAKINEKLLSPEYSAIVIDAALLIELNLMYMVDCVVLVYAEDYIQTQRLIQRGLSKEEAQKRINSQMPFQGKKPFADFIIYNNGPLSETKRQVEQIWNALLKRKCRENTRS